MKLKTQKANDDFGGYKIKDKFPGRVFSPPEQQRLAAQISGALSSAEKPLNLDKKPKK